MFVHFIDNMIWEKGEWCTVLCCVCVLFRAYTRTRLVFICVLIRLRERNSSIEGDREYEILSRDTIKHSVFINMY